MPGPQRPPASAVLPGVGVGWGAVWWGPCSGEPCAFPFLALDRAGHGTAGPARPGLSRLRRAETSQ